jgi:hypothetical protein
MRPVLRRRTSAAHYLRERWGIVCSTGTLANLAVDSNGPLYRLAGRFPVYAEADLDDWAQERLSEPRRGTRRGRAT